MSKILAFLTRGVVLGVVSCACPAQSNPPVTPGFPNETQVPGTLLSGLIEPQQGRLALIAYHNGVLFTVPESPSSQPGSDLQVRTWSLADPANPVLLEVLGTTPQPINAHGYLKRGVNLVLGSNFPPEAPWSFAATTPLNYQRTTTPDLLCIGVRGCLFQPWFAGDTYWSYDAVGGDASLALRGITLSSWDHLGLTGVIGHPFILGDLLIFASDQSRTGVATYDISDPANPSLLDVLTTGGPGGYWPELWGSGDRLYIVFPYRTNGNGVRIVEATDPADLRFVTDKPLPGDEAMYAQFQDEFAFIGSHKVDMRTFESTVFFDGAPAGISTSQFALPLGNLVAMGGVGEGQGLSIWAHQAEPDLRGPTVGFHIPRAGQANYSTQMPISLLIHETLESTTIINGATFIVRPVGGTAIAGQLTYAFDDVLTFTPDEPLLDNTSYEVLIPEGGIKDASGNGITGFTFAFSTGASVGGNRSPEVSDLSASLYPAAPGQSVTLSASASDADLDPLEYRFDPGDGSGKTDWSAAPTTVYTYTRNGHFQALVQVRDPAGAVSSGTVTVTVLTPSMAPAPTHSSPLVCSAASRQIWVVNPDNNSVTGLDADTLQVSARYPACGDPRSVAVAADGNLWISCFDDDVVQVLAPDTGATVAQLDLAYGAAPHGLAMSPNGNTAYVSLTGTGQLARFDTTSISATGVIEAGPQPRAIAVAGDHSRLFVTRFISSRDHAEIREIALPEFSVTRTLRINKFGDDANRDTTAGGRGVANYLAGITIAPDGETAWVAATKPNTERGLLFGPDLDQDNTVRNLVVQINLATGAQVNAIDLDNSDSATALAYSPLGDYLFVTLQGNNELVVLDALLTDTASGLGSFVTRTATQLAPQGVCADSQTGRVLVKNFLSRSVSAIEAAEFYERGDANLVASQITTVDVEQLSPAVLEGKQIFYNAGDSRMSAEGYLSCATCHVDGGHDGRVWDFSGRGEGLRNTITLRGRAGLAHGNVHWSGNFDEIQDFENDIRNAFGGSGFLTDSQFVATAAPLGSPKQGLNSALDNLAAYVASLDQQTIPRSPHRNIDGSVTSAVQSGSQVFQSLGCATCHGGSQFTDSTVGVAMLDNLGTLRSSSGGRLGQPLEGIDPPSLLGLWNTAPYLHDGSAATLAQVFQLTGGQAYPAELASVSNGATARTEFVQLNNDDTAYGRGLVNLNNSGARITFMNVDGGSGGTGAVEVRYSRGYGPGSLDISVNGAAAAVSVSNTGNEPGFRHTNWQVVRLEDVELAAGMTNTVSIEVTDAFPNMSIDEIVVATADERALSAPHRAVLGLPASDQDALIAYLRQLDGSSQPGVDALIFRNGFEN